MKIAKSIARLGLVISLAAVCTAQNSPPKYSPPNATLADIEKRLASEDFATRQAAQADLAKIPLEQLDNLRHAAQEAQDPEVKARINAQVEAMELYRLLHPPRLSLNIANATPAMVAAALNEQLGANFVVTGTGRTPGKPFTLNVQDQPFWEILRQLDDQSPLFLDPQIVSAPVRFTGLRIVYADGGPPHRLKVVEPFAMEIQVYSAPPRGNRAIWSFVTTVYCDPRIRILQAQPLQLDKLTDQDGRSLLPLVSTGTAPSNAGSLADNLVSWSDHITINRQPGLSGITELHGTIALTLLESEHIVPIDLTTGIFTPVETPLGKVIVEKDSRGRITARIPEPDPDKAPAAAPGRGRSNTAAANAIAPAMRVNVRMPLATISRQLPLIPGSPTSVTSDAAGIEIIWPDKIHEMTLPVEFKEIDVPLNAPPPLIRAGGGGAGGGAG